MQAAALVTSLMVEGVLGLTSRDRWQSLKQYDSTSVFATRWFIIAMVAILTISIVTLTVISLIQYKVELKNWWKNSSKKAEENQRQRTEVRRQKAEDQRQIAQSGKSEIGSAVSYESDLKELGQIADEKVVKVARQASSLIESLGLNAEQVTLLADYLVSRYVPIDSQASVEGNGVTK
jgi:hypothetical protein